MTSQKVSDILIRIIKVVEKEIPKIPIKNENELVINGHKVASTYEYHCPNEMCNEIVQPRMTYCPWCGQKIDWEEKDEGV